MLSKCVFKSCEQIYEINSMDRNRFLHQKFRDFNLHQRILNEQNFLLYIRYKVKFCKSLVGSELQKKFFCLFFKPFLP